MQDVQVEQALRSSTAQSSAWPMQVCRHTQAYYLKSLELSRLGSELGMVRARKWSTPGLDPSLEWSGLGNGTIEVSISVSDISDISATSDMSWIGLVVLCRARSDNLS